VAGNAVEHERVLLGVKAADLGLVVNVLAPKLNRLLVRHELAAAGILDEQLPQRAVGAEIAEDVAACAVEVIGDGAEDFSLRAFADTGGAEEEDAAVFHAVAGLGLSLISKISVSGTVNGPRSTVIKVTSVAATCWMRSTLNCPCPVLRFIANFSASPF